MTSPLPARSSTGGATQESIEHHYDVGSDFYRLWLGPTMVYSCALWTDDAGNDLEAAQVAKLDWHATAARAAGKARVLDVGCGWGTMMRYLREEHHVSHVTGLTLSSDQLSSAPTGEHYDARLEDWRQHQPLEPYDAVVSIGAFEHFARQDLARHERRAIYRSFFERCAEWLVPDGRLSLQTIAYEDFDPDKAPTSTFFSDEVFPESGLPQLIDIAEAAQGSFRLLGLRNDADHYARTLLVWQRRLEGAQEAATRMVGRATYRHYLRYLRVSRAMFDRRVSTLYRLVLQRRP